MIHSAINVPFSSKYKTPNFAPNIQDIIKCPLLYPYQKDVICGVNSKVQFVVLNCNGPLGVLTGECHLVFYLLEPIANLRSLWSCFSGSDNIKLHYEDHV